MKQAVHHRFALRCYFQLHLARVIFIPLDSDNRNKSCISKYRIYIVVVYPKHQEQDEASSNVLIVN